MKLLLAGGTLSFGVVPSEGGHAGLAASGLVTPLLLCGHQAPRVSRTEHTRDTEVNPALSGSGGSARGLGHRPSEALQSASLKKG